MAQAECARVQDLIGGLSEEVATTEEQHRMLTDQLQQMTKPQLPALGSAPPSSSVHTDGDQQRQQQQQCESECDLETKLLQCEQHSVALQVRCRSCWSVLLVGLAGLVGLFVCRSVFAPCFLHNITSCQNEVWIYSSPSSQQYCTD
jgi:hypothetical protein